MQRYGLLNKIQDLTPDSYLEYNTGPLTKGDPSSGNIYLIKAKPIRPQIQSASYLDPDLVGIRSAFPAIRLNNFLNNRKTHRDRDQQFSFPSPPSPVIFPTTEVMVKSPTGFFKDRIAYPGSSSRRTSPADQSAAGNGNLVPQNVFGNLQPFSIQGPNPGVIDNDGVDTLSLTLDMIKLNEWQDENFIFSPFSISNVLALLLLGSNGATYDVRHSFCIYVP